jgi:hypothetical protein
MWLSHKVTRHPLLCCCDRQLSPREHPFHDSEREQEAICKVDIHTECHEGSQYGEHKEAKSVDDGIFSVLF